MNVSQAKSLTYDRTAELLKASVVLFASAGLITLLALLLRQAG